MDETKTYINMCDCPEIQEQRKPKVEKMSDGRWHYEWELETGDYFATEDLYSKGERQIEIKGTTIYNPFFYDKRQDANIDIGQVGFDEGGGYITKKITWLPRQDQIQKMMGNLSPDKSGYSELLHDFDQFLEFERRIHLKSFEQLWLVFYMHEKHGKTWDGEKEWIA